MQRIAIIGPSGAGKSTLARMLGERTGLPVYHIDAIHWKAGWVESAKHETRENVEKIARGEQWIIEGNYSESLPLRLSRADMVVLLDFPRRIYLPRVIRRTIRHYGTTRPDLAEGCPERFDREFLLWVWNFHKRHRGRLLENLARNPGNYVLHHLRKPGEVKKFLEKVGKDHGSNGSNGCAGMNPC